MKKTDDKVVKEQLKQAFAKYEPKDDEVNTRYKVFAALESKKHPTPITPILWKWVAPAAFSLLAIGMVVGQMISPTIPDNSSELPSSGTPIQPVLQTSQAIFGFETVTATTLMPMISISDPLGKMALDKNDQDEEISEDEIAVIDHYLRVSEQVINGSNNLLFVAETSDRLEYDYKETVTTYTALGITKSYVYYYNITLMGEEDENSSLGHAGGHRDDATYEISGVVVYGDEEYELNGRKTEEVDGDESELRIQTTIKIDANNYVRVIHKVEEDEESYQYDVVENKRLISKVKMMIEKDDDKIEVKVMSLLAGSNEQIIFTKDTETPNLIEVAYLGQFGQQFTVIVYLEEIEGVTYYTYEVEESEQKYHREEHHHGQRTPNHRIVQ